MAYLSTEQVKAVRNELKSLMPTKDGWKLSVTREHYSTVRVAIMKSPLNFGTTHKQLNHFYPESYENNLSNVIKCMMSSINKGVGYTNYDRNAGDMGADYSDCNYYINIHIGKWDKECEYID